MTALPPDGAPRRFWEPRWVQVADAVVDSAVISFAVWTLWYEIALYAQWDLRPSAAPFLVVAGALALALAVRAARRIQGEHRPEELAPQGRWNWQKLATVGVLAGIVLAARDVLGIAGAGICLLSLVLVLLFGTSLLPVGGARRTGDRENLQPAEIHGPAAPSWLANAAAAATSLGLGVLSLFIFKTDADDAFYVNRAAWVAEHGTAALRDTMFGPETYPQSFGGGIPTPSIEALQGAVASLLGLEAGTVAYFLYAPLLATTFGWVTWRLVRAWAPRRHLLVFFVAVIFILGSGAYVVGNYSIGRMWQGKVTAVAVLLPLLWVYFTRLAVGPSRRAVILLCAGGIVFVGLTTSSALLMPMFVGAAVVAALVRRSKPLVLGAVAFAVAPTVNGLVQAFFANDLGAQENGAATAEQVFSFAFGTQSATIIVAGIGIVLAAGVARGPAAAVAGGAALAATVSYVPGVLDLADAVTGAGPVVWRLAIVAPVGVFVGLLVAVPVPGSGARWMRPAVVTVLVLAIVSVPVAGKRWLWSNEVGARLASSPAWKVNPDALADVRAARLLKVPSGAWLMPPVQMENLAIATAGPYAVVPRAFYLPTLRSSEQDRADRQTLLGFVSGAPVPLPAATSVHAALARLGVALACVSGEAHPQRRILRAATGGPLRTVGSMRCYLGRV